MNLLYDTLQNEPSKRYYFYEIYYSLRNSLHSYFS